MTHAKVYYLHYWAVYLYVWTVLGASRFSHLSEHGIIVIATAIARVYFRQAQSATTHARTLLSACSTGMMGFVSSYESLLVCATLAGVGSSIFHPEGAKIMNRLGGGKQSNGNLRHRR